MEFRMVVESVPNSSIAHLFPGQTPQPVKGSVLPKAASPIGIRDIDLGSAGTEGSDKIWCGSEQRTGKEGNFRLLACSESQTLTIDLSNSGK